MSILEIEGRDGKLIVKEDSETGHIYAVVPCKKIAPHVLRELREQTLDYWRYVEGTGLVLDLTIWSRESGLTLDDIRNKIEGKYREFVDKIFEIIKTSQNVEIKKRRKKKKKAKKKQNKKSGGKRK